MLCNKYNKHNVLAVGDPHAPYTREGYLEWCDSLRHKHRCGTVLIMGDLVENNSLTIRDLDPNMPSPKDEILLTREFLKPWFDTFSKAIVTLGNHDLRPWRRAAKAGIPDICIKPYREIYALPKKWVTCEDYTLDNVFYFHGFSAAKDAAMKHAIYNGINTVQGHGHTTASIMWHKRVTGNLFGISTGSGIDWESNAFKYARPFKERQIISCATIKHGKSPELHIME